MYAIHYDITLYVDMETGHQQNLADTLPKDYLNLSGQEGAYAKHHTQAQHWLFYYCDIPYFLI